MSRKDRLHHLVDELPDSAVPSAERYLEELRQAEHDPVLRAFLEAPEDDEPTTDEDRAALAGAEDDMRLGRLVPLEEVKRELGR